MVPEPASQEPAGSRLVTWSVVPMTSGREVSPAGAEPDGDRGLGHAVRAASESTITDVPRRAARAGLVNLDMGLSASVHGWRGARRADPRAVRGGRARG